MNTKNPSPTTERLPAFAEAPIDAKRHAHWVVSGIILDDEPLLLFFSEMWVTADSAQDIFLLRISCLNHHDEEYWGPRALLLVDRWCSEVRRFPNAPCNYHLGVVEMEDHVAVEITARLPKACDSEGFVRLWMENMELHKVPLNESTWFTPHTLQ